MGRICFCQVFWEYCCLVHCTRYSTYKITPYLKIDSIRHKQKRNSINFDRWALKLLQFAVHTLFFDLFFWTNLPVLHPLTFSVSESSTSFPWDNVGTCRSLSNVSLNFFVIYRLWNGSLGLMTGPLFAYLQIMALNT